jgi:xylulokinase
MAELLLAVDVGTSSVRAGVFTPSGRLLGMAQAPLILSSPHPGWAQQNPQDWWRLAVQDIRVALQQAGCRGTDVAAVAVTGQMQGVVPLRADGTLVVDWAQIWCDKRGGECCETLVDEVDVAWLRRIGGNRVNTSLTSVKIMWLKKYRREIYDAAAVFLCPKDYVTYRLTGVRGTDYSDASGTLLLNTETLGWSREVAQVLGVELEKLPPIHRSSEVIGEVTTGSAEATGLGAGTPVVAGGGDFPCAMLAAGALEPGAACESAGTSSVLAVCVPAPLLGDVVGNFRHVVDSWLAVGNVDTAGASLRWFADSLLVTAGESNPYDVIEREAATVSAGCDGLFFLPYLLGERTPADFRTRGVFLGLTPQHTRGHMARAIMEGVCFGLTPALNAISANDGVSVGEVSVAGGGAKSSLWQQIRADVYRRPVKTLREQEGSMLGAALLAGMGAGFYKDPRTPLKELVGVERTYLPDTIRGEVYHQLIRRYWEAYSCLRGYFQRQGRAETQCLA